jgi:CheY-like chemotaxis protein
MSKELVWVVDDNELILRMLHDILKKHDYDVKSFNHPAVVISRLINSEPEHVSLPHVMLVDYWMPDLTGAELVRSIRQMGEPYNRISFVGITSRDEPEADAEYTKLGMFLLRKPDFNESDILIRVMRAQIDRDKTGAWKISK